MGGILVNAVVPERDIPLSVFESADRELLLVARSCQGIQCAHYDFSLIRYTMQLDTASPETAKPKKRHWFFWF